MNTCVFYKICTHPRSKLGWTENGHAICTNPGCYEILEANVPCNHLDAFKYPNADGSLECGICRVALEELPTNETLRAERIHFRTDLSWNDLVGLQHALWMASQLPGLTRDTRDVVGRLLKDLDKARLDFPH